MYRKNVPEQDHLLFAFAFTANNAALLCEPTQSRKGRLSLFFYLWCFLLLG
jgi:hypothetical protein